MSRLGSLGFTIHAEKQKSTNRKMSFLEVLIVSVVMAISLKTLNSRISFLLTKTITKISMKMRKLSQVMVALFLS